MPLRATGSRRAARPGRRAAKPWRGRIPWARALVPWPPGRGLDLSGNRAVGALDSRQPARLPEARGAPRASDPPLRLIPPAAAMAIGAIPCPPLTAPRTRNVAERRRGRQKALCRGISTLKNTSFSVSCILCAIPIGRMPSSAGCRAVLPNFCLARTAEAVSGHPARSIPTIFQTLARLHPAVSGTKTD